LHALWYRHAHSEARDLLAAYDFPADLQAFALTILQSGASWSSQIDAGDITALIAEDRLWDFTRRPRTPEQRATLAAHGGGWLREANGYTPTPDEVNAWSRGGLGHDSLNCWACMKGRIARYQVDGDCAVCQGAGDVTSPAIRAFIDAWQPSDPPTGEGWQVWETVSEGSPVSPVCATADALIVWLMEQGYSATAAAAFVQEGWVPSIVSHVTPAGVTIAQDIHSLDME
jgi:hypothetical protein